MIIPFFSSGVSISEGTNKGGSSEKECVDMEKKNIAVADGEMEQVAGGLQDLCSHAVSAAAQKVGAGAEVSAIVKQALDNGGKLSAGEGTVA